MRKASFKSKPSTEGLGPARASVKLRRCKVCRNGFVPRSITHKACGPECAEVLGKQEAAKQAARAAIEDRKQTRAQLEALKTLKELRAEAQAAFNTYIRARDRKAKYGCICCGTPLDWNSGKPGGAVDAGHFVSRGSAIELAFDERNVNAQRKSCNRPGGTTRAKFTAGMIERWGAEVVAELEGPNDLPHLKHDDLRAIRDKYRAKAREVERAREREMEPA